MEALETFLNKYSSKFPKGYPDINNIEDRTLLYEMVYSVLNEKALAWMDLSSETRKYFRLSIIADKIKNEDPFTLETGEDDLTYIWKLTGLDRYDKHLGY